MPLPFHRTRFRSGHPGFSLVEIVLAIGLVSFSLLAIFAMVAQGQKTSRESRLESVSSLLAGKVNSQLRASRVWTNNSDASDYIDNPLATIAAASSSYTKTTYYNEGLLRTNDASPDRQFALTTEVGPVSAAGLSSTNADVTNALATLGSAKNTVFLNITVSYPALATDPNRSKRYFSSIITRTSTN